jgi:tripartite-type tricarboxylate transporter receptor subunit TctC
MSKLVLLAIYAWLAMFSNQCGAQQNSSIRLIVGTEAGGSYDLTGRLLSRHIGRYLPSKPTIIVQNMPGAGGLSAANYLYNLAPRDGSTIGIIIPQVVLSQIFDDPNARFNAAKFNWLGNPFGSSVVSAVFYTSTAADWREGQATTALMGATGTHGPDAFAIKLANHTLRTKFKIIYGYNGGSDMNIAMERGEIDGRGSQTWAGWKITAPDWVASNKIIPLWQLALRRDAALPSVPMLLELVNGEENKMFVRIYSTVSSLGRPLVAPPDTPPEAIYRLREAFDNVMIDENFRQDAKRVGVELGAQTGKDIQDSMIDFLNIDTQSRARLKQVLMN